MKKLFVLFLLFFTTDSHSSGIASNTNSAPCTNNTLETYSGNSNLSADWQPNEIKLRWYNGNTLMDVQSSANTCVYDSTLTIPQTAPTRTGYTFDGWTIRPEIDFATTIPTDSEGIERWAKGFLNNDVCLYNDYTYDCAYNDYFTELQKYEWKVRFSHGTLYGMARCSADTATYANPGNPTTGSGQYCWCKATGYKVANTDIIKGSLKVLSWISLKDLTNPVTYESANTCSRQCARLCAHYATYSTSIRTALFTPAN